VGGEVKMDRRFALKIDPKKEELQEGEDVRLHNSDGV